ncbi:MAG: rhodanese-like domain-containing protein [Gammaproteobacteria bacterium]|nr:rhodanese-like domain-containing protein [Gammaproteobacteria bacterium]NND39966.1 rhodanese-like domain-containing protein [Pseudomonadales bacterium]MBT8151332.1 rhodanese-like domain-containing protein [Gammaproteobacteria bacterium]NNL11599.1 rhodanese-like domain-containing protein [Pseudomonadales bacterium]NNM11005.1 rhodanese-like domain-containing protein [Pseudomonadales bacterium]
MEKFIHFASDQWLLITALAAAIWALAWLENQRAGKPLTPNALTGMMNHEEETVVVDLRDKAEFDEGHIVKAVNLPFGTWQSEQRDGGQTQLERYAGKPLVLVCKLGQQSSHVARRLAQDKFSGVYRLAGGISEWRGAQLPLVKS